MFSPRIEFYFIQTPTQKSMNTTLTGFREAITFRVPFNQLLLIGIFSIALSSYAWNTQPIIQIISEFKILESRTTNSSCLINNSSWTVLKKVDGILVEYQYTKCKRTNRTRAKEIVILRISNTTNETRTATWSMEAYRDGKCNTCNKNGEYDFIMTLQPNSSTVGNCTTEVDPRLKIFSKFLKSAYQRKEDNLTSFKLANFTVKLED